MAQIIYYGINPQFHNTTAPAQVTTAGAGTIPAASIVNAIYSRDCNGNDRTDTTAAAAAIIALIPGAVTGQGFDFVVLNSGASNILTVAGGSSVTVTGTATVGALSAKIFRGYLTSATAVTLQSCDADSVY